VSWFYKWHDRAPTERAKRRERLDAAVAAAFRASGGTYGSPRIHPDLTERGWRVSENTVASSMARQGLAGRKPKRSRGLTRQDRRAAKFPDLLRRDFTASGVNQRWVGDMTEIPTGEGKLYLASVLDLYGRRLLANPTSDHPDASSPATRSRWRSRGGVADKRSAEWSFTPIGVRPTPLTSSPHCAGAPASASPWNGSGRVSTTPPRSRSSPPSSMRSCPATTSRPRPRHGL